MKDWKNASDQQIVCYCQNVDKKSITDAIIEGATSLKMIQDKTAACTMGNCAEMNPTGKCCSKDILELIRIYSETEGQSGCCSSCCCSS